MKGMGIDMDLGGMVGGADAGDEDEDYQKMLKDLGVDAAGNEL